MASLRRGHFVIIKIPIRKNAFKVNLIVLLSYCKSEILVLRQKHRLLKLISNQTLRTNRKTFYWSLNFLLQNKLFYLTLGLRKVNASKWKLSKRGLFQSNMNKNCYDFCFPPVWV